MADPRIDALATVPLFASLSNRHLKKLLSRAVENDFDEGAVVVREGGTGDTLFVVLEGSLRIERDGQTVGLRTAGEFFGELAVITGGHRAATVVAETPTRCLVLYRRELQDLVMSDPSAAWAMLEAVAGSVREA